MRREAKGLPPFKNQAELEAYNADQAANEDVNDDASLTETGEILLDFIKLSGPQLAQQAAN